MKRLISALVVALALVPAAGCAAPQDARLRARLMHAGIVEPVGPQHRTPDPASATGFRTRGDAAVTSETTTVPCKRGIAFGIAFRVDGLPDGQPVRLTQVIRHPPMKKPDGSVIHEQLSSQQLRSSAGYTIGKVFYTLREEYEVVPGDWSIAILQGSTLLLRQDFKLEPAP